MSKEKFRRGGVKPTTIDVQRVGGPALTEKQRKALEELLTAKIGKKK